MMGVEPADYARHVGQIGAVALGANCGVGPSELMHAMLAMQGQTEATLIAKGNCGIPEYRDGAICYRGSPELMAEYAVLARDAGIGVIGGCCGTTPEHIKAMRHALDMRPKPDEFNPEVLWETLGEPWADIPKSPKTKTTSRSRRRR